MRIGRRWMVDWRDTENRRFNRNHPAEPHTHTRHANSLWKLARRRQTRKRTQTHGVRNFAESNSASFKGHSVHESAWHTTGDIAICMCLYYRGILYHATHFSLVLDTDASSAPPSTAVSRRYLRCVWYTYHNTWFRKLSSGARREHGERGAQL